VEKIYLYLLKDLAVSTRVDYSTVMDKAASDMENDSTISRRELLKILSAGGGALAASAFLPAKWVKPLIKVGVLPAHAQASMYTITATGATNDGMDVTLTVTISPAIPGIPMQAAVALSMGFGTPVNTVLTGNTTATGTATFFLPLPICGTWNGTVVFSFITPLPCSVCSVTLPLTFTMPC
jgi:hypothetical protein